MSLEQNKAIILEGYKTYDQGNFEQAKKLFDPNVVVYTLGTVIHSVDDFFEHLQIFRSTFSDSYHTFEDVIAEDDKVVTYGTCTGIHRQELFGIPPTGKQVICSVVHMDHLRDGKIINHWSLADLPTIIRPLRGENLI